MHFVHNSQGYSVENPSNCPHCHHNMEPRFLYQNFEVDTNYSVWKCTFRNCGRQFVAAHKITNHQGIFIGFLDGTPIGPHWPKVILELESKFIETYNQALKAESSGLNEISGMGYRKALEYLVKDYVIHKDSSLKGKVESKPLAMIILENFKLPQESDLKELLQRATWLGNDMTHYLRYHETFDLNDLKELIQLVMDEIHSIEQKRHYIANIQSKYK